MAGESPRIGFAGLGVMGRPIAQSLAGVARELIVWNRSTPALEKLQSQATIADTPGELGRRADVVFYCLADAAAVEAVVFGPNGVLCDLRKGTLVVDLGTSHPQLSRQTAALVEGRGGTFLDAPLFGSRAEAELGTLCMLVGGAVADFDRAKSLFERFSSEQIHMGGHGSGATAALFGSAMVAFQIAGLAEIFSAGAIAGIDLSKLASAFRASNFGSPLIEIMARSIVSRDFAPIFSLGHLAKDLRQLADQTNHLAIELPLLSSLSDAILAAAETELGREDASAFIKAVERTAR